MAEVISERGGATKMIAPRKQSLQRRWQEARFVAQCCAREIDPALNAGPYASRASRTAAEYGTSAGYSQPLGATALRARRDEGAD